MIVKETRFCICDSLGYGKYTTYHGSIDGLEINCTLGGFFWKSPFYIIEELEVLDAYRTVRTGIREFFTGIELNLPVTTGVPVTQGLYCRYPRELSPVEFEAQINKLKEKKRKLIASQVREYNNAALKMYSQAKRDYIQAEDAKKEATKRLRNVKRY